MSEAPQEAVRSTYGSRAKAILIDAGLVAAAAAAVWLWTAILRSGPWQDFRLWPWRGTWLVAPLALPLIGLVLGIAGSVLWRRLRRAGASTPAATEPTPAVAPIALAASVFALMLLAGVAAGGMSALRAAALLVVGPPTALVIWHAALRLSRNESVGFDSHWGGLGGGIGGWRISSATVLVLVALILSGACLTLAVYEPQDMANNHPQPATNAPAKK
jgi:hypothetical protein